MSLPDDVLGYRSLRQRRARRTRRVVGATVASVALLACAATVTHTLDGREWTGESERARLAIRRYAGYSHDQREAMVVLLRDARESVALLRELANGDDAVAAQARAALDVIVEDATK